MFLLSETTNQSVLLQLGVGGIFAMLVLRTVFDFLNKQREQKTGHGPLNGDMYKLKGQVAALYKWHEPEDDGEQSWKNKHVMSLLTEIKNAKMRCNEVIEGNTRVLERVLQKLNE